MDKFKEEFLEKVGSDDAIQISEILDRVDNQEKIVEVVYYALLTMSKSDGNMSPLLDWDM